MVSLFSPAKHLSFSEVKELPALSFFQDLNINIYADKFSSSEVTEPLLAYFNYFPETIEDSRYRQEVATDLSDPDILESVSHFISGIGVAERYLQYSEKVTSCRHGNGDSIRLFSITIPLSVSAWHSMRIRPSQRPFTICIPICLRCFPTRKFRRYVKRRMICRHSLISFNFIW